jgi:HlyD family secretion protein
MPVEIELTGIGTIAGVVRRVEPSAFTRLSALGVEEQRVHVIATLAGPPATLGDGFRVEARIITWRGDNLVVAPASALFRDRDGWAVYVVDAGRARVRRVELGRRGRLGVEVRAGLAPGERVLLYPSDRITSGTRIAPR